MPEIRVESVDYVNEVRNALSAASRERSGIFINGSDNDTYILRDSAEGITKLLFDLIMKVIRPLETARLIKLRPIEGGSLNAVLISALRLTETTPYEHEVKRALSNYVSENSLIIPEGFVRFRLQYLLEEWACAMICAAEMGEEMCEDITNYVGSSRKNPASGGAYFGDIDMTLFSDGSFVLTDEMGCRLECDAAGTDAVMKLLASLLPGRLTVYDLTGGSNAELLRGIKKLFGIRARIFVKAE